MMRAFSFPGAAYSLRSFGSSCVMMLVILFSMAAGTRAQQKEIEVSTFYAKVYVAPSTNANFVGLIQKGERYPIITVRDNWYNIRFKNVNGWIEFSQAKVIDPQAEAAAEAAAATDAAEAGTTAVAGDGEAAVATVSTPGVAPASQPAGSTASARETSERSTAAAAPRRPPRHSATSAQPQYTPPPKRTPEKRESRIRSWFTQQNVPELPPVVNPNADREARILFFYVNFPSGVRRFLDPGAPILGMTKRGQTLQVIGLGDSWCKVAFSDTIGWVETKTGKIIDPAAPPPLDFVKISVLAGVVAVILLVLVVLLRRFRRLPMIASEDSGIRKRVLIVSRTSKTIQYSLTNGTTSLDRCFSEVGFDVSHVREGASIKNRLQQEKPDVIMIDYQFDHSIIPFMEKVCSSLEIADSIMTITYNVPDPNPIQPGKVLKAMLFLGTSFSDRDVFKLITPMLRDSRGGTDGGSEQIQKSSHTSALAGNIADGNLLEVLQFIEIGSKTGCLLVELEKPFAIICFKNGRINFAATADKITGRDAIFKVLGLKNGKFRFVLDKKPKESNVNLSTLEVLMEWTKTIDEARVN